MSVALEPIQSGSGDPSPTNIRPISGRTGTSVTTRNADNTDSNTVTLTFNQTVYGGSVNFKTGVLTITHKFKQFDGSESWSDNTNGYVLTRTNGGFTDIKIASNANTPIITNMFQHGSTTWLDGKAGVDNGTLWIGDTSQSTYGGLAAFKTFLSEHNLQMVYPIAPPTTVQLTPAQLMMLKGYNSLITDGGDVITITAYVKSTT